MPKILENKLKISARKKGLTGDKFNAYVYGTMAAIDKLKKKK